MIRRGWLALLVSAVAVAGCGQGDISVKDQESKKAALDKISGDTNGPQDQ